MTSWHPLHTCCLLVVRNNFLSCLCFFIDAGQFAFTLSAGAMSTSRSFRHLLHVPFFALWHARIVCSCCAVFVLGLKEPAAGEAPKQTRAQTIASIVNTMMGTAIVALPYGISQAGIIAGICIIAVIGAIACFTCVLLVEHGKTAEEFSDIVRMYLGVRVQLGTWAISVAVIGGAAIVYHILMQESLYQLIATIITAAGGDTAKWSHVYAALLPLVVYPATNLKDLSALVKLNSVGFLFLWFTIIFVVSHGARALSTGRNGFEFVTSLDENAPDFNAAGVLQVVVGGRLGFAELGGMMMLSFFIHNAINPIIKNAPVATRKTDVAIAYVKSHARHCFPR